MVVGPVPHPKSPTIHLLFSAYADNVRGSGRRMGRGARDVPIMLMHVFSLLRVLERVAENEINEGRRVHRKHDR